MRFKEVKVPISPLDTAIREIGETRSLLQRLVTSSESFNYALAKETLQELDRKLRELGRIKSELVERQEPLTDAALFPRTE